MKLRALVLLDYDLPDAGLIEAADQQKALQSKVDEITKGNPNIVYSTVDMR